MCGKVTIVLAVGFQYLCGYFHPGVFKEGVLFGIVKVNFKFRINFKSRFYEKINVRSLTFAFHII